MKFNKIFLSLSANWKIFFVTIKTDTFFTLFIKISALQQFSTLLANDCASAAYTYTSNKAPPTVRVIYFFELNNVTSTVCCDKQIKPTLTNNLNQ